MDINIDAIKAVAISAGRAGAPFIEQALTAALAGASGPFGLLVAPALNIIFPMINEALGLAADTPPEQTAAAIDADPDAAKDKLASLAEDHQFQLAAAKQDQDFTLASQAQQVQLDTVEAQNPSWLVAGWRPALAWGLGALMLISFALPFAVWFLQAVSGHQVPPPPALDAQAIYVLGALLGITVGARSYDKAKGTAAVAIGGTSRVAVVASKRVGR